MILLLRSLWLTGLLLTSAVASGQEALMLADFERGFRLFSRGDIERATPLAGRGSLRLDQGYASLDVPSDWSGYDTLHIDVVNPQRRPVRFLVEIRDAGTEGYWSRVNFHTLAPPGTSAVLLSTRHYTGEKAKPGPPLDVSAITHLILNVFDQGPLLFDNIRLERDPAARALPAGAMALDFGPPESPVLAGFVRGPVDKKTADTPVGWLRGGRKKTVDCLQPDPLTQDQIFAGGDTLRIDLANGMYRIRYGLDYPGGYWGEVQKYRRREVLANGRVLSADTLDAEAFTRWYFRHADREDRPGIDPFDAYVMPLTPVRTATVAVTNGVLDLSFRGVDWVGSLAYLVVCPEPAAPALERFWSSVQERRRAHFANQFRQVSPPRRGAPAPAEGIRLFHRAPGASVHAFDGPAEGEALPADGLSVDVLQGEERAFTFSLQPGPDAPGPVHMEISPLTRPGGEGLPVESLRPGWIDYRLTRRNLSGSIYTVAPRYLRPLPASMPPGITRRFWIRVRVPVGQPPGTYRGVLRLRPEYAPAREIPLALRVHPHTLHPIDDLAVGPWGSGIRLPWFPGDPVTEAWDEDLFLRSLGVLHEAGATSLSGRPNLRVTLAHGRATLHTERADREMAQLRAHGFTRLISAYGITRLGYHLYQGLDEAAARRAGYPSVLAALRDLYTAIDAHAAEQDWLPVAWNLCDEPGGGARMARALRSARQHRDILPGLDLTTFMGATALTGADPDDPHTTLAATLPLAVLNPHDEAAIEAIHEAGGRFGFYNGGNRWTLGRYMKALVEHHDLALRLSWHYNNNAGDPYYALDAREDDFCWFNATPDRRLRPSMTFLQQVLPGYNDYRLLRTLQVAFESASPSPARSRAEALYDRLVDLAPGIDRAPPRGSRILPREEILRALNDLAAPP